MLKNFTRFFVPQDREFYKILEEISHNTLRISEKLVEFTTETQKKKRDIIAKEINALEEKNDSQSHEIFILLSKNFITPFDREDIHSLTSAMDDICDYIYASVKRMNLYKCDPNTESIKKFAKISLTSVKEVHNALLHLREKKMNSKIIKKCIIEINRLENEADGLFDYSIEKLFDLETDPIEVIKQKDIFQTLEIITDKCEDAGNVIESIMVKYM